MTSHDLFDHFAVAVAARILHLKLEKHLASRKRLVKQSFPGVLAVAGTSVLAFHEPDTLGDHSFQVVRLDSSKGRNPSFGEK